jgi:hypothetical protein
VSGSTPTADGSESDLLFVIISVRATQFIRVFLRQEKVLTAAKWNEETKDTSVASEGFLRKLMCPQRAICYLIINML